MTKIVETYDYLVNQCAEIDKEIDKIEKRLNTWYTKIKILEKELTDWRQKQKTNRANIHKWIEKNSNK